MAAPVTHIVFAVLVSHLLPIQFDFKEFVVGTSFPDIRYSAQLTRTETHFEPVSWQSVLQAPTAFEAGMKFHNLLDIYRMEYLDVPFFQEHDDYSHRTTASILKLCEDMIIYSLLSDEKWNEIREFFDTYYAEEIMRAHENYQVVKQWHSALQEYFKQPPCFERFKLFIQSTGGSTHNLENHKMALHIFLSDTSMKKRVIQFYNNFLDLLSEEMVATPDWVYTATVYPTMQHLAFVY